jgi:flagellar motor switch protein FliN/FliY
MNPPTTAAQGARPLARPFRFPELQSLPAGRPPLLNLSQVADLPFVLDAPLGSLELDVRGLLDLRPGSVLQLDRFTGEPLEITVNGTPIARGEVRIHGERFAVRVTEILRAEASQETGGKTRDASKKDDGARGGDGGDARARTGR